MTITPGGSPAGTYASTAIMTDRSILPQYEGRPVPWVTRWTGEVNSSKLEVGITRDTVEVSYPGGRDPRDAHGILWKREGLTRRGKPQWSQVNTYRQRAAMLKRKCQVCGTKIDERPIRWLVPRDQLHETSDGPVTISAPTCSGCIPLARELCPFLRTEEALVLKVLAYEPWGVYGEGITVDRETGKGRDLRGIYVSYDDPPIDLSAVIAFQQIILFTKFVIEE